MSIAELVRRRLREPKRLARQLVVGEALAEPPRRGLAVAPPRAPGEADEPDPPDAPPAPGGDRG